MKTGGRMRRREFVAVAGAGFAGSLGTWSLPAGRSGQSTAAAVPGLQLYTVRSLMQQDVEGTLAAVAEIGYREVEFAGEFGRTPAQLRGTLDRLGLRAPARHVAVDALERETAQVLEACATLGNGFVVVAWIPAAMRGTVDDWRRTGERFNRLGEAARRAGLRFAYHNHDFEFAPLEGRIPFDVLLESTDPTLVAIELDLYWITKGGQQPLDYLRRERGRYVMVHVKDMDATPARGMADPGRGVLDFAALVPAASSAGVRHFFVEHDTPADPLETARVGFAYLRRLLA
jgi:sugar phosphate isomerase/epimerase